MAQLSDFEQEILHFINEYRASKNLAPLVFDEQIQSTVLEHSQNMASGSIDFGHDGFKKRAAQLMSTLRGISAAENVAYGQTTPGQVVQSWLDSDGHRKNIEGDFSHTGIGLAEDGEGRNLFTQFFLKVEEEMPVTEEEISIDASILVQEIINDINEYRATKNLHAFQLSREISEAAQLHSDNIASGNIPFGHDGFKTRATTLLKKIKGKGFAENVASGHRDTHKIVQSWLKSDGHRKNIEGAYTLTGIGVAQSDDGQFYYTQIFVKA
ncbi:MAG: CAP domain-containing protein [Aureispira sp.]|nr:CAP domain-containing protein [Aureispira sp.]